MPGFMKAPFYHSNVLAAFDILDFASGGRVEVMLGFLSWVGWAFVQG